MKNFIYIILLGLFIACASTTKQVAAADDDKVVIKNEELEYEIIIIEPGFNTWLVTQQPMGYYSQTLLEQRNHRFVVSWNQRVLEPFRYSPNLYERAIDYDPHVDYGMEVNYKLFMYFRYFQQKYQQQL